MSLDLDKVPELAAETNCCSPRLHWENLSDSDCIEYGNKTDELLQQVQLPDVVNCTNIDCHEEKHINEIKHFYDNIIAWLQQQGILLFLIGGSITLSISQVGLTMLMIFTRPPEMHFLGQPPQGPLHELHKKTKARFKYALRFITKNEKQLRKEALAKKLTDLNPNAFCWKEIKLMNNSATPLPVNIAGVNGNEAIAELWKNILKIYSTAGSIDNSSTTCDDIYVTEEEVESAIKDLESKKSCGADGI